MCAIVFAVIYSLPLLPHLNSYYLADDWDRARTMDWVVWDSLSRGQFPWSTPYLCGGIAIFANPLTRVLSPFVLLHLIAGPVIGTNLEVPIHLAIGWLGGFFLGRVFKLDSLPAAVCASVFVSSSWLYLHFGAGAVEWLTFVYAPWIIACWHLAWQRTQVRWALAAGALMALSFFEGATYTIAEVGLLLGVLTVVMTVKERNHRPLLALFLVCVFTVVIALPKLYFTIELGRAHSRATSADQEYLSLSGYWACFFSRDQNCNRFLQWSTVGFQPLFQGGAYLSPAFVLLAAIGVWRDFKGCLPWIIVAGVFLIIGMGNYFGPWSPYVLLHELPLYSWLRVSPKFFVMIPLAVGVMAALGAQRCHPAIAATLLGLGLLDCWLVGPPNLWRDAPPGPPLVRSPVLRQVVIESDHDMLRHVQANYGVLNCYVEMAK
jgi:hypothetical protein